MVDASRMMRSPPSTTRSRGDRRALRAALRARARHRRSSGLDLAFAGQRYFNSGCPAGSYHSFTVTVVDSCGAVGYGQSSFICQPY
jgi:hypothetical protein